MRSLLQIAKKELKQNIRDIKITIIMTLIPIAVILIMGVALSSLFSGEQSAISHAQIDYFILGDGELSRAFETFADTVSMENIHFSQTNHKEPSIQQVKNNKNYYLVEIDEHQRVLKLYKNNRQGASASIIEGVMNTFITHSNMLQEVNRIDPLHGGIDFERGMNYTTLKSVEKANTPSAMDYYGVVMCTLFVLYNISIPLTRMINEKKNKTLARMLVSPINKKYLLFGKLVGGVGVTSVHIGIVLITTLLIFNVNWGSNPLYAFLLIFTQIVLAICIGVCLGFIFDSEGKAIALINVFIVIAAFFGGSYMPLEGMGVLEQIGRWFSPLWWTNRGLLSMIYTGQMTFYYEAIAINLGIAAVFIMIAAWRTTRKEELLNG